MLEAGEAAALEFPHGLPGLECSRRFVLMEKPEISPIVCLQSLDSEDLRLWAAPVSAIDPEYSLELSSDDARTLGLDATLGADRRRLSEVARGTLCLAILCAPENGPLTANLLAPVVVNLATRIAVQAVRSDNRYSHRHAIAGEEASCS